MKLCYSIILLLALGGSVASSVYESTVVRTNYLYNTASAKKRDST